MRREGFVRLILLAESRASRASKGVYLEWNIPLFSHCNHSDTFLEDARQRMGPTFAPHRAGD